MIMCFMSSTNLGYRSVAAVVTPIITLDQAIQNVSYNIRYAGHRTGLGNRSWLVDKVAGG